MDITKDNFNAALDGLLERIAACDFYAIDLEMTGINSPTSMPEDASMPLQRLYEAKRHAASRFAIIQVGICLFHKMDQSAVAAPPASASQYARYLRMPSVRVADRLGAAAIAAMQSLPVICAATRRCEQTPPPPPPAGPGA